MDVSAGAHFPAYQRTNIPCTTHLASQHIIAPFQPLPHNAALVDVFVTPAVAQ
jgi:hypothetical protein